MTADGVKQPGILLVRCGFIDGSAWKDVYHLLRRDQFDVTVVQNTTRSLEGDAATVQRALDRQARPVVLVGHAYGGAVITEAGIDPKVKALVYIAGFAPDKGESVRTLMAGQPAGSSSSSLLPPQDGFHRVDRERFHASFAADLPPQDAAFLADAQVPCGVEAMSGMVIEPAWRMKPSWYLVAGRDRMIPPSMQRAMADRAGSTTTEVTSSHAVYASQPDAVARIIKQAALDTSR